LALHHFLEGYVIIIQRLRWMRVTFIIAKRQILFAFIHHIVTQLIISASSLLLPPHLRHPTSFQIIHPSVLLLRYPASVATTTKPPIIPN
jgi:hypothetical protein